MSGAPGAGGQQGTLEQLPCAAVIGSADKLIIGDTRLDRRTGNTSVPGPVTLIAWAGVPPHAYDNRVMGVLWVADQVPRQWSATDVAALQARTA